MKQNILIPALFIAGYISLLSCGDSAKNKPDMKSPEKNMPTAAKGTENTGAASVIVDPEAKTIANMQAAIKSEINTTAKYAAFSKKAVAEGYNEIAILFKAASIAENVHAINHKAVLAEMGVTLIPVIPELTVTSTKENLELAIKSETYEAEEMYPSFLKEANSLDNQIALISLNYAYKTEKKHKVYFENALVALNDTKLNNLPVEYYICPTCGNTYAAIVSKRCGVSLTGGEKFIKISSL